MKEAKKSKDSADRGRLTPGVVTTILAYIKSGSFDYVAAQAAGISPRTFREWMARGEGRSPRPSTPELREFAEQVRKAKAEARVIAEAEVHRAKPLAWLAHAAPSKDGERGWSKQPSTIDLSVLSFDELEQLITQAEAHALAHQIKALYEASDLGAVELTGTKRMLTARRHWELLVVELRDVVQATITQDLSEGHSLDEPISSTDVSDTEQGPLRKSLIWFKRVSRVVRSWVEGGKEQGREPLARTFTALHHMNLDPLRDPAAMKRLLTEYAVGRETIRDEVGKDRFTRIVADLTVVAWNAFPARLEIGILKPIGGLLRLLRLLALTTVRSRKWWLVSMLTIIALSSYLAVEEKGWFGIGRFGATIILLAAVGILFYGASRPGRLFIAALLLGVGALLVILISRTAPWTLDPTESVLLLLTVLELWWLAALIQDRRDETRIEATGKEASHSWWP